MEKKLKALFSLKTRYPVVACKIVEDSNYQEIISTWETNIITDQNV